MTGTSVYAAVTTLSQYDNCNRISPMQPGKLLLDVLSDITTNTYDMKNTINVSESGNLNVNLNVDRSVNWNWFKDGFGGGGAYLSGSRDVDMDVDRDVDRNGVDETA